jgi:hypothetical protein
VAREREEEEEERFGVETHERAIKACAQPFEKPT